MTVPIIRQSEQGLTPVGLRRLVLAGIAIALAVGVAIGLSGAIAGLTLALGLVGVVVVTIVYIHRPFSVVVGFWVFLLLQTTLASAFGKGGGIGGLLSKAENPMIILLLALAIVCGERRPRGRWLLYAPAAVFLFAGFISAVAHHVPFPIMLLGGWLGVKAWSLFVIALHLPWDEKAIYRVTSTLIYVAVPIALLTFVDFVFPGPFRSALRLSSDSDVRLGIQAARSIFPNPALLSSFMFLSLCVLVARIAYERRRFDILWAVTFAVAAVLSLRFKAVLGILAAFAVVALLRPRGLGKAFGPRVVVLLIAAVAVGGIGYGVVNRQVSTYASTNTPRNQLAKTSFDIAAREFPIGVGFGRFGSTPSGPPYKYSPVYKAYGIWLIKGLNEEKPDFLHDTSWATVIGETGALGWLAYAGGLVALLTVLALQARNDQQQRAVQMVSLAGTATMVAFLFDSAGRPAIFGAFTCLSVGLVIAPALALGRLPGTRPELPDVVERILSPA